MVSFLLLQRMTMMTARFKHLYHGGLIGPQDKSIEHIIPKRLFVNRHDAEDPMNKAFCDPYTNSMRSDFRFGDISRVCSPDLILPTHDDYRPLYDKKGNFTGLISRSRRVFYPSFTCDYRHLSSSILHMLYHYPYLYSYMDQIVCEPGLLHTWTIRETLSLKYMMDL